MMALVEVSQADYLQAEHTATYKTMPNPRTMRELIIVSKQAIGKSSDRTCKIYMPTSQCQ